MRDIWRKRPALSTRLTALLLAGSCLSGVQAAMPETHT